MLTTKQLENRKSGIGGSDVAAIMGLSNFKSSHDVYLEKIGVENKVIDNERLYMGRSLEPFIVNEFEKRTDKKVILPEDTFRHPDHKFMIANVDGILADESAILECKTCSTYAENKFGQEGTDDIPNEYLLQCAHYCCVLNKDIAYIAVLIGVEKFKIYKYIRNKSFEEKMIAIEKEFWNAHVIPQCPPPLTKIVEDKEEKPSIASFEIQEKIDSYRSQTKIKRELERSIEKLKLEILNGVGKTGKVTDEMGNKLATINIRKSTRFDSRQFKQDNPILYDNYKKNVTYEEIRL